MLVIDWGMLGAVLGALALGYVIRDDIARRREIRDVVWMIDAFARTDDAGNQKPAEVFEIRNGGSATAHVSTFGMAHFEIWQADEDSRLRWQYGPGESRRLFVQTEDAEAAWVLLTWVSSRDIRFMWVAWVPLVLRAERWAEDRAAWTKPWWRRPPVWRRGPVGPGGRRAVRIRLRSRRDVASGDLMRIAKEHGVGSLSPGLRDDAREHRSRD